MSGSPQRLEPELIREIAVQQSSKQREITTFLGVDLVRKLNDWFSEHIGTVDKKMGEFLALRMGAANRG